MSMTVEWWSWCCAQGDWRVNSTFTVTPQQAVAEAAEAAEPVRAGAAAPPEDTT